MSLGPGEPGARDGVGDQRVEAANDGCHDACVGTRQRKMSITLTVELWDLAPLRQRARYYVVDEAAEYGWSKEFLDETLEWIDKDADAALFYGCRRLAFGLLDDIEGLAVLEASLGVDSPWPDQEGV